MYFTGMNQDQVDYLQTKFAYMTDRGWVIPDWLLYLELQVVLRDFNANLIT